MKTYTALKALTANPHFKTRRVSHLAQLNDAVIDAPLRGIVQAFNQLPFTYTLQSCYGHFLHHAQTDPHNLEPLPPEPSSLEVDYRIAYIAFCVENNAAGRRFLRELGLLTEMDPNNIQLCCAMWFWNRQVNSYVLQVEPDWCKHEDQATLAHAQALDIERLRNRFFPRLAALLRKITDR